MSTARDRQRTRAAVVRFMVRALCVVFAFQLVIGVFGDRGLLALLAAKRDMNGLRAQVAAVRRDNAALQERIQRLKEDPSAIEELARRELGLIKPGEIVVTVREVPAQ